MASHSHRAEPHTPASAGGAGPVEEPAVEGPHSVCVRFPDFRAARQAIEHMERAGLDGANMAFDSSSLAEAADSAESGARDERFLQRAVRNLGRGALVGAAVGLIAGLAVGVALFADGPTIGIVGAAVAATAAGGLVGIAMGGVWGHKQTPAWEETFEAPDAGEAVLHIGLHNAEEVELVREAAREHDGALR